MYLDTELVKFLYLALVRPHLEFAVSVWNPHLVKHINKLEKIQHRATKLPPNLRKRSYDYRLKEFGLTSLEVRRERGDLIQFYKIINQIDHVKLINEIRCPKTDENTKIPLMNLRDKEKYFYREGTKASTVRENFLVNRIIPSWNKLRPEIKNAKTLNSFKAGLDRMEKFSVKGCYSTVFTNTVA